MASVGRYTPRLFGGLVPTCSLCGSNSHVHSRRGRRQAFDRGRPVGGCVLVSGEDRDGRRVDWCELQIDGTDEEPCPGAERRVAVVAARAPPGSFQPLLTGSLDRPTLWPWRCSAPRADVSPSEGCGWSRATPWNVVAWRSQSNCGAWTRSRANSARRSPHRISARWEGCSPQMLDGVLTTTPTSAGVGATWSRRSTTYSGKVSKPKSRTRLSGHVVSPSSCKSNGRNLARGGKPPSTRRTSSPTARLPRFNITTIGSQREPRSRTERRGPLRARPRRRETEGSSVEVCLMRYARPFG
jgi:hypothetical protein